MSDGSPLDRFCRLCGPGLLYGQSFTAETTGRLEQIQLKVCCVLDAQLALRTYIIRPCTEAGAAEWNAGKILGTSQLISPLARDWEIVSPPQASTGMTGLIAHF